MDSKRWEKIQHIFEQALEVDNTERASLIRSLSDGDDEICHEVLSLLDADNEHDNILDKSVGALLNLPQDENLTGRKVGPYILKKEIGQGGMGAVYLAERDDTDFKQVIALKIIKRGMDTDEILRRFSHERQILAGLKHPNIARLYDGGITDDGLPYFTMEFVDGEPITDYCNNNRLSIDERLTLFLEVLDAVIYAQSNLIVHRDLKPGNIFITKDGTVKLLDFGIAKLIGDNDIYPDSPELTKTGYQVMTPGYASPEQVRGEPVTTASDVYSLGIVLYELLTGHRPYIVQGISPFEIEKVICTTDPSKPSTVISRIDDSVKDTPSTKDADKIIAELRHTTPEKLKKKLRGDLDNISMKALTKEAGSRYTTAQRFSDDIRRHLKGLPVSARAATLTYRFTKFIRRNTFPLSAAVLFIGVISSLTVYYTINLSDERDKAKLEAEKAKAVSEYVTSLFEISNPNEAKGQTITARELLDEGAARLETDLADQPEIQVELMDVISNVYYSLSQLDKAKYYSRKAVDLSRQIYNDNDKAVSVSLHRLGDLYFEAGDYASAESLYTEAVTIDSKLFGANDTSVAYHYTAIGSVHRHLTDYENAKIYYEKALKIQRDNFEPPNLDLAYTLANLGRLYQFTEQYDTAEKLFIESLEMRQEILGLENFETVASLGTMGSLMLVQENYIKAIEYYTTALNALQALVDDNHRYVGGIMGSLAYSYYKEGNLPIADSLFKKAIGIAQANLPENHVGTTPTLSGYGQMLIEMNMLDSAYAMLSKAYTIRKTHYPPNHRLTIVTEANLGYCLFKLNKFSEAEEKLTHAYAVQLDLFGPDNHLTKEFKGYLQEFYTGTNQPEKAAAYR